MPQNMTNVDALLVLGDCRIGGESDTVQYTATLSADFVMYPIQWYNARLFLLDMSELDSSTYVSRSVLLVLLSCSIARSTRRSKSSAMASM